VRCLFRQAEQPQEVSALIVTVSVDASNLLVGLQRQQRRTTLADSPEKSGAVLPRLCAKLASNRRRQFENSFTM
jgi:hypothetical protein